ncbi:hypothetical protein BDV96DRAFT_591703 [Lophiotrema nucula]|uniref:SnoaL-like domain-containing protein n=1 Tax=Lophiotrema nucula TaxID=690887 RepID=A0A6A5YH21_9PLEO|nr:hypothetical protein BDV96DRAFT_591703 [Lophiotrema nucula]
MPTLRELAVEAIGGYNKWNMDAIMAYRDETCVHEILPKSLQQPTRNNTEYRAYFAAQLPLFEKFHVIVSDVFEDVAQNRVAVWCSSTAETPIGPYKNEYVMMFYFDGEGKKVVKIKEFVDSAGSKWFFGKLEKKLAEGKL